MDQLTLCVDITFIFRLLVLPAVYPQSIELAPSILMEHLPVLLVISILSGLSASYNLFSLVSIHFFFLFSLLCFALL